MSLESLLARRQGQSVTSVTACNEQPLQPQATAGAAVTAVTSVTAQNNKSQTEIIPPPIQPAITAAVHCEDCQHAEAVEWHPILIRCGQDEPSGNPTQHHRKTADKVCRSFTAIAGIHRIILDNAWRR